ncbi:MAG: AraC family transcriptional regulator [Ignavibacteria bacterium]|nr:AraC family transcriptional regulator [Ignavibacteria bacterium]MCU7497888.1 AraC family transcriptional regulator [Ignavibacteria bacterium]MCU7511170.1 AraC family transcriptional regulator [Ignavibacteria bacterium]MCU7518716.1 AraC family transcriptional regulator [Ignavibacteria bacterium]MCU7522881.1 AraC family transcriptional regulator [Ignavibacteria bacterium]
MENMLKMKADELIDPAAEIHYAFHRNLKDITVPHYHDFYEIFIITKGSVIHKINGQRERLTEGTLVFIRPEDRHYYEKSESEVCELLNLAFPKKAVSELFSYLGKGFMPERLLLAEKPPYVLLSGAEKNFVVEKLEQLNVIPRKNKEEIKTRLRVLLLEIFTRYFPLEKAEEKSSVPQWLRGLCTIMQEKENFIKGLPVLQELSHRSPEHLCRVFKKYLNTTPTEFINDLRLNYAANVLSSTDLEIIDVSARAGFENLSHFYHLFKERYSVSPGEFRKLHKKSMIPS